MLSWGMHAAAAVLAALVFGAVLWPLRRGHGRCDAALLGGAVLALGMAAAALYALVGTPRALQAQNREAPRNLEDGVAQLQAALAKDPNRAEGWALLARSQMSLGRPKEAATAFARAVQLAPDKAQWLVQAAEARALATPQRQFDAQGVAWLRHALQVEPTNERAAWFLGIAQRQHGQHAEAAATWEALLPRVDAATAAALRPQIDAARADAGLPALPAAAPGAAAPAQASATAEANAASAPASAAVGTLTVSVSLDPGFAARVRLRGDASVFVIARVPGGPPMPVAVQKHSLQSLPLRVTLSDSDSPMPTQTLSQLKQVQVLARLSNSGNAMRQEGDLESAAVTVTLPTATPVELVIGKQ
ncbi:tetratricopeptide repeat protein [Xanthomonas translucens]|uniref:tetratricopeptide repeat protein n=4 Tax=Xanthomonas campestris pv. translucens TaxID=343 RepID=UPI00071E8DA0|nr:tetratricopeptide repeat protein [Xanthomonas translucens]MCS3360492.1 tetratricopeptide repeat protein [Xanthomonas translucens pv. translucens]MCS3374284.1 tetratricopeptide repeat protein [Xanthomonas translucens pv. translucens]MCT8275218.1 tetratricopeptide repeat protein [Xanthomonas translucens pv. translucens]MCT8279026.1 tetratricopeptide repeat protein [Xanthomonas translucens pv. translucens]MCT8290020.1 tetratricopeptide repeat protein [Xanthomonas translucens pv. translucens]